MSILTVSNKILRNIGKVNNNNNNSILQCKTQSKSHRQITAKHIDGLLKYFRNFRGKEIDNAVEAAKYFSEKINLTKKEKGK